MAPVDKSRNKVAAKFWHSLETWRALFLCIFLINPQSILLIYANRVVPTGKNNMYRMPIDISIWGTPDKLKLVKDKLLYSGFVLKSALMESAGPGGSGEPPMYVPQASKSKSTVLTQSEVNAGSYKRIGCFDSLGINWILILKIIIYTIYSMFTAIIWFIIKWTWVKMFVF